MSKINMNQLMTEVINGNPGYDGLKKKAIYVAHEDMIYHGFEWSDEDRRVMADNVEWHKANNKVRECEITAEYAYCLALPPTLNMWLDEQPWWINGTAKERKKELDKLIASEPIWKACKREM
ncbi:unnamed protein product [marine sediment metagenome]|uniref:Uncharacterized protein n=1 Tax=marine sediment metagenome TaxID=412755 RepID=X0Z2M2_9ZZZZ